MTDLKLARLPDRTPVKMTIVISPELNQTLQAYAAIYAETYGKEEAASDLIPAMLAAFMENDRGFVRARGRS